MRINHPICSDCDCPMESNDAASWVCPICGSYRPKTSPDLRGGRQPDRASRSARSVPLWLFLHR